MLNISLKKHFKISPIHQIVISGSWSPEGAPGAASCPRGRFPVLFSLSPRGDPSKSFIPQGRPFKILHPSGRPFNFNSPRTTFQNQGFSGVALHIYHFLRQTSLNNNVSKHTRSLGPAPFFWQKVRIPAGKFQSPGCARAGTRGIFRSEAAPRGAPRGFSATRCTAGCTQGIFGDRVHPGGSNYQFHIEEFRAFPLI